MHEPLYGQIVLQTSTFTIEILNPNLWLFVLLSDKTLYELIEDTEVRLEAVRDFLGKSTKFIKKQFLDEFQGLFSTNARKVNQKVQTKSIS